jgi:hypothetical protein
VITIELRETWYIVSMSALILLLDKPSLIRALRGAARTRDQSLADRLATAAVQR